VSFDPLLFVARPFVGGVVNVIFEVNRCESPNNDAARFGFCWLVVQENQQSGVKASSAFNRLKK
jgi:hypothetical protein